MEIIDKVMLYVFVGYLANLIVEDNPKSQLASTMVVLVLGILWITL